MNSFPSRRSTPVPQSLSSLAVLLGCPVPARDLELHGIAPLDRAGPDRLGLLADRRYLPDIANSRAGAFVVSRTLAAALGEDPRPRLEVEDAHRALTTLLERFHPEEAHDPQIHSTAILGRGVSLGTDVRIGPYAVLESGCVVGDGTRIGAHAVLGEGARVGREVVLHPHVVLYPGTILGDRTIVHAGARLGVDGFGYVFEGGVHRKVPQVGECVVEEDVEIGANTTIDRGSIGRTEIGRGAKLDNLVQVGHNAVVGPLSILAGQVGVAGSTRLGTGVVVGGQAGVGGHLSIGDGARLAGQAGVTGNVAAGETVMGFPARPRAEYLRTTAAQARLGELRQRVRRLEERFPEGGEKGETGEDSG